MTHEEIRLKKLVDKIRNTSTPKAILILKELKNGKKGKFNKNLSDFENNLFLKREVQDLKIELGKAKAYADEYIEKYNTIRRKTRVKTVYKDPDKGLKKAINTYRNEIRNLKKKIEQLETLNQNQ